MNYYIEGPTLMKASNRKCKDIHEYVSQFRKCIVPGDYSRYLLISDIKEFVWKMNDKYPRTKELKVRVFGNTVLCGTEDNTDKFVFTIRIMPIEMTYERKEVYNDIQ